MDRPEGLREFAWRRGGASLRLLAIVAVLTMVLAGRASAAAFGASAWGENSAGQLGNGTTTSSDTPVAVKELAGVTAISAGGEHSLALLSNGTVMAWGNNEAGQLGNGKNAKSNVPVAVKGLTGVTAISAGGEHSLALLSNGTVMAWGANAEGQLGNGKNAKSNVPVAVKGLTGVTAISAGGEHSLALLKSGAVMAWGSNLSGQLGVGSEQVKGEEEVEEVEIEKSDVPVAVKGLTGVKAVAAGGEHSLALLATGVVVAWGSNSAGQLGNGTRGGFANTATPVSGLTGVAAISAGAHHSLALLAGGTIMAWGYNPFGQLGDGSKVDKDVPVAVADLVGVAGISAGGASSLSFGTPSPIVTELQPIAGPTSGGTSVTITGTNLTGATAVDFGSTPAKSFEVTSATTILAVSPPGIAGKVTVTVTGPGGTSGAGLASEFTYIPPPTITKVSPAKGPSSGETMVTITGTNLTGATAVDFGSTPAKSFEVTSATTILAVSPAHTSETADITVTTPSGTSAIVPHDHFKFEGPTILSVSPDTGPVSGGESVTITGSGFALGATGTVFKFGKAQAGTVDCTSTTTCVVVAPAAIKAGTVDVTAAVGKSKSKKNPPGDQFTYG
jgi:hypothetical protein